MSALMWFDLHDGPKWINQEGGIIRCFVAWNEYLVGFGCHGRDVTGVGLSKELAIKDAFLKYETARGRLTSQ